MKLFNKILSAVLCVIITACVAVPAFASNSKYHHKYSSKVDEETPIIYVPGIFNMNLVNNDKSLFFPEIGAEQVINIAKELLKLEDTKDYDGFIDTVINQCHEWCDGMECDNNGDPIDKSVHLESFVTTPGIGKEPMAMKLAEQIGYDKVFVFNYDWRKDIVDIVKNSLRPYVENVLKQTGAKKVTLYFMSMGGALGNVYIKEFGNLGDTKTVVLDSGAQGGVSFVSDLVNGEPLYLDRESVVKFVESAEDGVVNNGSGLAVAVSSISNYVFTALNKALENRSEEIFKVYMDLVGNCAGVLELGDGKAMQKGIAKRYDAVANKELLAKVNNYYDNYQSKAGEIVKTANDKKYCNVRLIAHYNCVRIPAMAKMDTQCDFLIDTAFESCGATVLKLYKTFDSNYKVKSGTNQDYLSLDYMVDASTCADPEHTWFIKNVVHCCQGDIGTELNKFGIWLGIAEDGTDIHTDKNYPQWMIGYGDFKLSTLKDYMFTPDPETNEKEGYVSSALTTYTYTKLTALGWAVILLVIALIIILIAKKAGNKEKIEGVLTSKEIKALPKEERKPAKQNNKVLKKQYKKDKKAEVKAHKAELKAMPKDERKEAIKADKATKKENKKTAKAEKKTAKQEKKANKKSAKAEKKTAKANK